MGLRLPVNGQPLPAQQHPYNVTTGRLEDLALKYARNCAEDRVLNGRGFEALYYALYQRLFDFLRTAAINTAVYADPPFSRYVLVPMPQYRLSLRSLARIPDYVLALMWEDEIDPEFDEGEPHSQRLVLFEAKPPRPLSLDPATRRIQLLLPPQHGSWKAPQAQVCEQAAVHFGSNPTADMQVIAVVSVGRWWKWTVISPGAARRLPITTRGTKRVEAWVTQNGALMRERYPGDPNGRAKWSPPYGLHNTVNLTHIQGYTRLLAELNNQVARYQPQ